MGRVRNLKLLEACEAWQHRLTQVQMQGSTSENVKQVCSRQKQFNIYRWYITKGFMAYLSVVSEMLRLIPRPLFPPWLDEL